MLGHHAIDAKVGVAPVYIILAVVIADAGSPHTITVLRRAEMFQHFGVTIIQVAQRVTHDLPIHQIA